MTTLEWLVAIAAWLSCGGVLSATCWAALPSTYPLDAALPTGLGGGFLGGVGVLMTLDRPVLSVYGAAVGALVLLDLEHGPVDAWQEPRSRVASRAWSLALLVEPVLAAVLVGLVVALLGSRLLGLLIGAATIGALHVRRRHIDQTRV